MKKLHHLQSYILQENLKEDILDLIIQQYPYKVQSIGKLMEYINGIQNQIIQ